MTDHDPDYRPEPAPAGDGGTGEREGADLWIRFAARLIDSIIISIAVSLILVPIVVGLFWDDVTATSAYGMRFSGASLLAGLISAAITIGYFAFLESSQGRTLGKMLLGLRTIGPDGSNPTLEEATKRNIWYLLGVIPVIGGLAELAVVIYIAVTINSAVTHQGWHDQFAGGTNVIKDR